MLFRHATRWMIVLGVIAGSFRDSLTVLLSGTHLRRLAGERGQTTAEYALVLLGAGALALLLLGWAGSTDRIGRLLDAVFGQLLKHVKG